MTDSREDGSERKGNLVELTDHDEETCPISMSVRCL
jgi:hypothetical protein